MPESEITNAELMRLLARIEAKLDLAIADHESRIRRVERTVWTSAGLAGAGLLTAVGSIGAVLGGGG